MVSASSVEREYTALALTTAAPERYL